MISSYSLVKNWELREGCEILDIDQVVWGGGGCGRGWPSCRPQAYWPLAFYNTYICAFFCLCLCGFRLRKGGCTELWWGWGVGVGEGGGEQGRGKLGGWTRYMGRLVTLFNTVHRSGQVLFKADVVAWYCTLQLDTHSWEVAENSPLVFSYRMNTKVMQVYSWLVRLALLSDKLVERGGLLYNIFFSHCDK